METPLSARALLLLELTHGHGFGQELIERIHQRSGAELKDGSAYPALASLLRDGLVCEVDGYQPNTGRQRRYYSLTCSGADVADRFRATVHAMTC